MVKIKLKRNNVAKNASSFSMKLIRLVLYTIGLLSLVVALFTAHQINSTYGSFDAKPFDVRYFRGLRAA